MTRQAPGEGPRATPEPIEFDPERILFHGDGLLVVDKPPGIPVHQGTGHDRGVAESLDIWVSLNPGVLDLRSRGKIHPIHLLERETSGVLLLGLTRAMARTAKDAFSREKVEKRYLAVVAGPLEDEGHIRGDVRSRVGRRHRYLPGELSYRRLRGDERLSLVEVRLLGTRPHQVRALFAGADRPLAGDARYGKPRPARTFLDRFEMPGFLLHLRELLLPAGVLGPPRSFVAPTPGRFEELCRKKGWSDGLEEELCQGQ
ncbi:MAG: RNA pseudouridine synthase [Planctomycetota bacterium]|nr:RNA pseudouridine synthase [Planctomycetota bacterium]